MTIRTATGKEFDSDYAVVIPRPEMMFIRINSTDIANIALAFTDPSETSELWHGENHFSGYDKFVSLIPEQGAYKICLERS